MNKEEQKKLLTEIMEADAKDGLYKQQTAVEWFISKLPTRYKNAIMNDCKDEIIQAKQMEKEQIEDAFQEGKWNGHESARAISEMKDPTEYYNETYGK